MEIKLLIAIRFFFKRQFVCCFFLLFFINTYSQTSTIKEKKANDSLNNTQKDIADLLRKGFLKKNIGKADTTLRQKGKLYPSIFPAAGYTLHTKFLGSISANGAFYVDDPDKVNLSVINLSVTYTQNRQFYLPIISNIWTKKNKYNFLGKWVYFNYRELTYGLGGHTELMKAIPLNYNYILIQETALKNIRPDFFVGIGYNLDYHWDIKEIIPADSMTDFKYYGFTNNSSSSAITLSILYDNRRNPINPPKGHYVNIVYRSNLKQIGSDQNWQSMLFDFRRYYKISDSNNNVLALWSYNWITLSGNPPYLDLPSTMWDTYVNQGRGYIQSRFKGKKLLALESEYRFTLTHNGLLGAVVFANVQSVSDWPSGGFNVFWPGVGAGIRMKANKHSNTNISIDYGIGRGGSGGIFANLGEVF